MDFDGEVLGQPDFSTQWLFLAHFLGHLEPCDLQSKGWCKKNIYIICLQWPSGIQHGAPGVFRLCPFIALGPVSPANPDYCREKSLRDQLCVNQHHRFCYQHKESPYSCHPIKLSKHASSQTMTSTNSWVCKVIQDFLHAPEARSAQVD